MEVVAGPAAGQRLTPEADLVLGRTEDGDGALGGDPELSRRHALLRRLADGRLLLEDLGSTNGTWVNGTRIPAPTLLGPGDEVALGASVLRISAHAAPAAPAPREPPPRQPVLRLVEGWAPGTRIPIDGPLVVGNDAAGSDAFGGDPQVAAEHARVTPVADGRMVLEDLAGGTLVNGSPIPGPTVLSPGDRFQVGGQTLELVEVAQAEPGSKDRAAGGVREVPEGLFQRIAGRAPVTDAQVAETYALALGWALATNLFIRTIALEVADVSSDLRAVRAVDFILATVLPVTFNTLGFRKIFRRPDYRSVRRYLIPTFGVPILGIALNVAIMNHRSLADYVTTIAITGLPILITAPLMLRLRERVARERLRKVRE